MGLLSVDYILGICHSMLGRGWCLGLFRFQGGATMGEVITIRTDIRKARRKHREHISGAGAHDSRPKRLRTRAAKVRHEVDSWS